MRHRQLVRLAPDYATEWPLWDETGNVSPADLDLTPELAEGIRHWQRMWEQRYRFDVGWNDAAVERRWAADGYDLARRLHAELQARRGPGVRVRLTIGNWVSEF
jgi:hypothetical protein